jgi:hypothetical protein
VLIIALLGLINEPNLDENEIVNGTPSSLHIYFEMLSPCANTVDLVMCIVPFQFQLRHFHFPFHLFGKQCSRALSACG